MMFLIDQLNLGESQGRYRVEAMIGQGAYSLVYKAMHISTRQVRALKVAPLEIPGVQPAVIEEYRCRFQAGAEYGIRINDPRVVPCYAFGQDGDLLILAMEYAHAGNLATRLWNLRLARQMMSIDDCVMIALDIAEGLAAVHHQDVVYGNLKPSNILFDADGQRARLADLVLAQLPGGLSMLSQVNQGGRPHPGTPAYMSPEQRRTTDYLSPSSDVFALGLLLFEMLTGRVYRNVRPGTRPQLLRSNVPTWLDDLIVRMLANQPDERPWDGADTANLLRHQLSNDAVAHLSSPLAWGQIEAIDPLREHEPREQVNMLLQDARLQVQPDEPREPPLGWIPLDELPRV